MTKEAKQQLDDWFTRGTLLRIESSAEIGPAQPTALFIWTRGRIARRDQEDGSAITIGLAGSGTLRIFPPENAECHLDRNPGSCILRLGTPGSGVFTIFTESDANQQSTPL
jgi:hypothetical protein